MIWRDDSARASPAGLPSLAQKNGHSLTRGSRGGSHARIASRQVTRPPATRPARGRATTTCRRADRRPAACERARKFRRRERAGLPAAMVACQLGIEAEAIR